MKLEGMDGNKKTGKILFEIGILIMIGTLLATCGIWQCIVGQWKVSLGGELFPKAFIQSGGSCGITYLNQENIYISFLSVLFSFLGNKEEKVLIINLILQLLGILFFYLGSKKLFGFVFPLSVAFISGVLSGCFYPVIMDTSMHMVWFLAGGLFWICALLFHNLLELPGMYLKYILMGILVGISCYVDIAGIILFLTFVLFILLSKGFDSREKFLHLLCFFLCVINSYFVMFYLWNNFNFDGELFRQWIQERFSYCITKMGIGQYVSLGIIMVLCVIFYVVNGQKNFLSAEEEEEDMTEEIAAQMLPLVFEEGEAVSSQTTTEEAKQKDELQKPVKLLENPLPLPKKYVKKEMDYAFEPTPEQMHYDLNNYNVNDDYDLK